MNIDHSIASPNHSARDGRPIDILVIHATAGHFAGDIHELTDNRRPLAKRVSVHYYVRKDGRVYQLVSEDRAAWHAGVSFWGGHTDINERSIGIELENLNTGADPYPPEQFNAAVELGREIVRRYGILPVNVVRHLDIAPARKTDPAGFDWMAYKRAVFR